LPFVITVVSANRPGNISYVTNTIHSLYCALNTSGAPNTWPAVLVLNSEVPAARHTALAAWVNDPRIQDYQQHGLSVVTRDAMHSQLHEPAIVQDLVSRAAMTEEVGAED
jgi:glycine cleavage system regulatory protein